MPESVGYDCPKCLTRRQTFEYWDGTRLLLRCQVCGLPVEEGGPEQGGTACGRRGILVIDDDPLFLAFVSQLLVAEDFLPLTARDGRTGLLTAHRERPAVILVDVRMPDLDGFAVCRQLRADARVKETPLILITATRDPRLRAKGFRAGANLAIEKPVDPTTLIATIKTALELKPRAVAPAP